ncbi:hypothetical protein [Yersinia thracica]|nr:hypothetical protein [Yersinia thracica]
MYKIIELIKATKKSPKPTQKVNGKDMYVGGAGSDHSSHCQGGGGW